MNQTILLVFVLVFGAGILNAAPPELQYPTPDDINAICQALPDKPIVTPKQERSVLVYSVSWGYVHAMIPFGQRVFDIMGKKTGAFHAVISDDPAMFEPEKLQQFDAIILNNTNNEIFQPEFIDSLSPAEQHTARERDRRLRHSFANYLENGGGLAVFHAGVASFRTWPEFGDIVGARFDNHPWVSGSTVMMMLEEPDHPLVQSFPGRTFPITDEIYQVKAPYSRTLLRVLVKIDTSQTDMTHDTIHRTDGDFAQSWIKQYGKGRVFFNAWGHDKHIYSDPAILGHWLAGIQYVLGDLECDDRPGAR